MNLLTLDSLPSNLQRAVTIRTLVPDQILFRQGDSASSFFVVATGRFKLVRHTPERRTAILQIVRAGDSFGESVLLSKTYPYTSIAQVPSQVIAYPKQPLLSTLHQYPNLAENFIALLIKKSESLIIQLELRDIRAAHTRVLQYLRYLAESGDRRIIQFDRPLKEVASGLGLTPATLSRALSRLEQEGIISREHSVVILQDPSAA